MTKINGKNIIHWITAGLFVFLFMFAIGALMYTLEHTFVNCYVWFAVMALLGMVSSLPCVRFWQWVTGISGRFLCCVFHTLFFTVFVSGMLLGLNFVLADTECLPVVEAEVAAKYSETRYRSRRVGRNRYVKGEPYKVYKVEFVLDDGRSKKFQVPLSRYNRLRQGSVAELHMGGGALGIPIIAL
ncbi:MAG: hypothetical protein K2L80_09780 [Muribaculaceae bacterium]|nr:hypothetical protein [Muribaculaceae bacterium]MDE6332874.1 hypothetical protein [Muribaculaceae bacterium]